MKTLVVFPGRFQPAHQGHLSVYEYLCNKFGGNNVYVATSNAQAPATSPFSFADKVQMWTHLGVPASRVVQVKNPYNPLEITSEVPDPEDTALVLAISEKDMQGDGARFKFGRKKDGSPSFMQPFPKDAADLAPLTEHSYVLVIPTVTFQVSGVDANSATEIRKRYLAGNDSDRRNIIHDLYGIDDPALRKTFDQRLAVTTETARVMNEARRNLPLCESRIRTKYQRLIDSIRTMEASAQGELFREDLAADYFKER